MKQMALDFSNAVKMDVISIKAALEQKIANQEYTQYLGVVENKDGSISIRVKSILVAKIKLTPQNFYIEVKPKHEKCFINFEVIHISDKSSRINIAGINDVCELTEQLSIIYVEELLELSGEFFGCCHRYVECSDALRCLHPDFLTSLACSYKRNLEAGKVFYGKNKNI